ncbi:hypothetical protein OsI_29207 [Oryza sativa Indica Group]|uniref:DUF8039 domain-containing protein n=1 Tax=Oryza sativa subsp. indica TaxID=39946 RepID=B8BAR2_ORYSI|nr:hypothetical protein OsI_29207 [Oryza sativa Indica Group]
MADNNNNVPPMQEDNNTPVPPMQEDNDTFFANQLFNIVTQPMSMDDVLGIIGRDDNVQGDNVARPENVEGAANVQRERVQGEPSSSQRVRDLEQTVAAQGSKLQEMESEMERRMKVAWLQIQQATGGTGSTEHAPLQQAAGGTGSTEHAPGGTGSTEHAPLQDAALISPPQQYQSSHASTHAAEPVAYGMTKRVKEGQKWHCNDIPHGYVPVEVEQVVAKWEDLELDIPGGDGETKLGQCSHCIILWSKADVVITGTPAATNKPPTPPPSPRDPPDDDDYPGAPDASPPRRSPPPPPKRLRHTKASAPTPPEKKVRKP